MTEEISAKNEPPPLNILVAAGSPDSVKLIERLRKAGHTVTVLNLQRNISDTLMKTKGLRIVTCVSTVEVLGKLMEGSRTNVVIDESNPFSLSTSQALMEASELFGASYCRYEGKAFDVKSENIIFVKDNAQCIEILNSREGNALLTIGSSHLSEYTDVNDYQSRLFVKIQPNLKALNRCFAIKISEDNIFAVKNSISKDFIKILIAHSNASIIVSKDTSAATGVEAKIEAAEESGVPIILINRPEIQYVNKFRSADEIIAFVNSLS